LVMNHIASTFLFDEMNNQICFLLEMKLIKHRLYGNVGYKRLTLNVSRSIKYFIHLYINYWHQLDQWHRDTKIELFGHVASVALI
ncbi:hypothetical protein ACJX0J_013672, partial [Zea mays]